LRRLREAEVQEEMPFVVAAHPLDALAEHVLALFDGINLIHLKAPFGDGVWWKCSTQKGVQQSNTVVEVRGVSQDRVLSSLSLAEALLLIFE
jgi:hypothetical protein